MQSETQTAAPEVRDLWIHGTASAAQSFIVISIFSLFSVFIAPLIMDSAQKIALTSMASLIFAIIAWQIANLLRKNLITQ